MVTQVRFQRRHGAEGWEWGLWEDDHIVSNQQQLALEEVLILPPCTPSKIIGIGKNYRDHAREMGGEVPTEPLIFLKAPSALLAPGDPIVLPSLSERVDYEGELAVVMGQKARNVSSQEAHHYIAGFTCANDVTARDLQKKDQQWSRAKGFDSFCPLGPVLVSGPLAQDTVLETQVNGTVVQRATLDQMVFGVPELIAHITQAMTLYPGDVILTGTPAGVGPLSAGDRVTVSISGIGILSNPVIKATVP